YLMDRPSPAWQEAAFVGNWFIRLTPREADELGRRLFEVVDEVRRRPEPRSGRQALVTVSVLPAGRSGNSGSRTRTWKSTSARSPRRRRSRTVAIPTRSETSISRLAKAGRGRASCCSTAVSGGLAGTAR